ncbi:MAG: hypothetical protein CMN56_10305 [Sneathiella sp.]|uniref:hypothetical protein n=1 Tax=Sneathiella sp. TaxID=1964365 RepID=UPI000C656904|nr:hypothetical protein [Sneathiella sp.]MAZ03520.1 hypothetical protein [Sneathiella sp.]
MEAERDLSAERQQSRPNSETAQKPSTAPVQLRDIQQTFISARDMKAADHSPYSAQFLTQQLAQQEDRDVDASDVKRAHIRATAAYDNSLNLTATIMGFDGRMERLV